MLMLTLASCTTYGQMADYELQELTIDVNWPVTDCEISLILDDIYYPIKATDINGSIITLHLAEYQDYTIIIDCYDYLTISLLDGRIIDEQDLSISADVDYQFEKGILVFNY